MASASPSLFSTSNPPLHYVMVLFPGFQLLDAAGPLDILNLLSLTHPSMRLTILSNSLDPVPIKHTDFCDTTHFSQSISPTMTYDDFLRREASDIDVLLIPGGIGARTTAPTPNTVTATLNFLEVITKPYMASQNQDPPTKASTPKINIKSIVTICTGSFLLARTGILDGLHATTNRLRYNMVVKSRPQVNWEERRWLHDTGPGGLDIWTSAGISAGIDVTFAFLAHYLGKHVTEDLQSKLEYEGDGWRGEEVAGKQQGKGYD